MQVAGTLVPLLKFYFHEEVRKAAVSGMRMICCVFWSVIFSCSVNVFWSVIFSCSVNVFYPIILIVLMFIIYNIPIAMPELLRSAKLAIEKGQSQGRDVSYLKFLTDSIVPALVEALHKVILIQVHPHF
jgi:hypothetical protein